MTIRIDRIDDRIGVVGKLIRLSRDRASGKFGVERIGIPEDGVVPRPFTQALITKARRLR